MQAEVAQTWPPPNMAEEVDGQASSIDGQQRDQDEDDIPKEWGWPEKPYDVEVLREHVLSYTQETQQERWDAQLEARAVDSSLEDHMAERVFANVLLNKEDAGLNQGVA